MQGEINTRKGNGGEGQGGRGQAGGKEGKGGMQVVWGQGRNVCVGWGGGGMGNVVVVNTMWAWGQEGAKVGSPSWGKGNRG